MPAMVSNGFLTLRIPDGRVIQGLKPVFMGKGCAPGSVPVFARSGGEHRNVREWCMVDLGEIGKKIADVPEHLQNEHVSYWLLFRDWGVVDALDRARALFESSGWTSDFHDEYEYFLRRDAQSVYLHVDTEPEGWIATRGPSGEEYEGPKWPKAYTGKLILEVWSV